MDGGFDTVKFYNSFLYLPFFIFPFLNKVYTWCVCFLTPDPVPSPPGTLSVGAEGFPPVLLQTHTSSVLRPLSRICFPSSLRRNTQTRNEHAGYQSSDCRLIVRQVEPKAPERGLYIVSMFKTTRRQQRVLVERSNHPVFPPQTGFTSPGGACQLCGCQG